MESLVQSVTVFVLAVFIGFEIITKVPPTLHTPLMSGSNAISGITLVGAIISTRVDNPKLATILAVSAVTLAICLVRPRGRQALWSWRGAAVALLLVAILFPITAFVALGFEHSIANMFLITFGMMAAGQGSGLDLGGLIGNLIPVTLGNIVGGSGLVAFVYWLIYRRRPLARAKLNSRPLWWAMSGRSL